MSARPPAPVWPALLLLLLLAPLSARGYDPALSWHTLHTPHFRVHYHDGAYLLAVEVARVAEEALDRVVAVLQHTPDGKIELVITDDVDTANGSAQVVPYNIVHVYASAPDDLSELNDFDDYLQLLLLHELSHIVHMDTVSGLPAAINWIFGRSVYPNGAQPPWFIEGLAVRNESALSTAGRIRSSLFQMFLRTAALSGTFPEIDEVSGAMRRWPQGTSVYLFGGFFLDYLSRRFGEQVLSDLSHEMSGMLVPWTLNIVARRVMETDYLTLWRDWKDEVLSGARATLKRLEQEGLSAYRRLTDQAQLQLWPRFSPGGSQILYFSSPTNCWPALRLVGKDGSSDHLLVEVNGEGGAAFLPNGQQVIFSQPEVKDEFYVFNDLFAIDLENGKVRRLTSGLRAFSPDVSPDGRFAVFVHNRLGKTRLGILELARPDRPRWLPSPDGGAQVYTPRFSPDGRQVAFSASVPGGGRNLYLLDLDSGSLRRLTSGAAMDLDPVFAPDGRRLFFTSDRSGIYNLHSLSLESGRLSRLTNLATGAFSPDPASDGSGIAFVVYGAAGYDIAWIDLPARELPVLETREPRPALPYQAQTAVYPAEDYQPWGSLLPRSWFPLFGADPYGATFGLLVGGQDVLGKLSYLLSLTYGPGNNQVYFDLGIGAQLFYPSLSFFASRHVFQTYSDVVVNDRAFPVIKQEYTLFGEIDFPFSSIRQYHALFLNYDVHFYKRWTAVPLNPEDTTPLLPDDRTRTWLGIGWYGSNARSYIDSISPEEGMSASVSLRLSHPDLGSGATIGEGRFALRAYLPTVRSLNHVLAFGLQGGAAIGDWRQRPVYSIGGLPIRDPIEDSYFGYRYADVYLRGYEPDAFAGWAFLLASLEYRLPVWAIERGVLSLPLYLRRLHAGVFVDVGSVALKLSDLDREFKVGLGAELRLDMLVAYYLPMGLRLGYARGVSSGGVNNIYLTLGSGF